MEFWISKFEKCINKILSLDKETCYELGKFDNQVIAFEFENGFLNKWATYKISPIPLEDPRTISSWFSFFSGLTIIFVSALSIINFSIIKSLIFSSIISILFGVIMWKAIKDLLTQVEAGTVKEIDEFF